MISNLPDSRPNPNVQENTQVTGGVPPADTKPQTSPETDAIIDGIFQRLETMEKESKAKSKKPEATTAPTKKVASPVAAKPQTVASTKAAQSDSGCLSLYNVNEGVFEVKKELQNSV